MKILQIVISIFRLFCIYIEIQPTQHMSPEDEKKRWHIMQSIDHMTWHQRQYHWVFAWYSLHTLCTWHKSPSKRSIHQINSIHFWWSYLFCEYFAVCNIQSNISRRFIVWISTKVDKSASQIETIANQRIFKTKTEKSWETRKPARSNGLAQ